jgi:hypothetical protein
MERQCRRGYPEIAATSAFVAEPLEDVVDVQLELATSVFTFANREAMKVRSWRGRQPFAVGEA